MKPDNFLVVLSVLVLQGVNLQEFSDDNDPQKKVLFKHRDHGYIVSTLGTAPHHTIKKILCYNRTETPHLIHAWFGLDEVTNRFDKCLGLPKSLTVGWSNVTNFVQTQCQKHKDEEGCRLPTVLQLYKHNLIPKNEIRAWLICYKCHLVNHYSDVEQHLKRNDDELDARSERYQFYFRKSATAYSDDFLKEGNLEQQKQVLLSQKSQTKEERLKIAKAIANQRMAQLSRNLDVRTRVNLPEKTLSDFFNDSEVTVGLLTSILHRNENMNFSLDNIGKVMIAKMNEREDGKSVNVLQPLNNQVKLNLQESLLNPDKSAVVGAVIFDPTIVKKLSHMNNVSGAISVTAFDAEGNVVARKLTEKIVLNISHADSHVSENQRPRCTFWDFESLSWSSDGCEVVEYSDSYTICECDHLTNFGVIIDLVTNEKSYDNLLRTITLVCCTLSVLGLIGSLIFFLSHRGHDLNDRIRITTHFCFCLLLVQVLMIFGISDETGVPALCKISSFLLHLSILATFTWSLLSGHQIYVLLIQVFDSEHSKMKHYYIIGYGFPVLWVVLSIAMDAIFYESQTYGSQDICWMKPNALFYIFFLAPVVLILGVNIGMLGLVILKVYRIRPRPHMFGHARGWFSLALLLGGTWAFGVIGKIYPSIGILVTFILLNSLQGLLIFIFHVLLGQRCRSKIMREIETRKKTSELSSSNHSGRKEKNHQHTSESLIVSTSAQ